jgi:hypothetical protein
MSFLKRIFDERFLEHRKRSTSTAGIVCAVLALCLFEFRYFVDHRWNWDLFAVGVAFVGVKLALMTWYYLTD